MDRVRASLATLLSLSLLSIPAAMADCDTAANPFVNCGFESGNFQGWQVDDLMSPSLPATVVGPGFGIGYGFFDSDPSEGSRAAVHGFDGEGPDKLEISQTVFIPANASLLAFDYRMAWDFWNWSPSEARTFEVVLEPGGGGAALATHTIVSLEPGSYELDSGHRLALVSIAEWAGQSLRVIFRWQVPESFGGPAFFQLDNVRTRTQPPCVEGLKVEENRSSTLTSYCQSQGGQFFVFNVPERTDYRPIILELGSLVGGQWELRRGGPGGVIVDSGDEGSSDSIELTRGTWAIRVFSSGQTGSFEISVGVGFGVCGFPISLGESVDSFFHALCPTQLFFVEVNSQTNVILEMRSNEIDSYLSLSDSSGQVVAFDDNGGVGLDARITASLSPEHYTLSASTPTGTPSGNFTILTSSGGSGSTAQCPVSLSDPAQSFDAPGGTHLFSATVGSGCSWQATADRSWIQITSGSSGTGNGQLTYEVSENYGTASRSGNLRIHTAQRERLHRVTQAGTSQTACTTSATRLCLNEGRFAVDVDWKKSNGETGLGQSVELTDDTGYLWFFNDQNVEMVIKVLDACGVNNRFWVFAGGLTDVETNIEVVDTATGQTQRYSNPQSTPFQPIQDTGAFATCSSPVSQETIDLEVSAGSTPHLRSKAAPRVISEPRGNIPEMAMETRESRRDLDLRSSDPRTASTLYSQLDRGSSFGFNSQNYLDSSNADFDNQAADDFNVPSGSTWSVDRVRVSGFYSAPDGVPEGPASSLGVFIFEDNGGRPGSEACRYTAVVPVQGLATGDFIVDLPSSCQLASGRHWISVQVNQWNSTSGQWFWLRRLLQAGRPAQWRNPGNGFSSGCTSWTNLRDCSTEDDPDLLFAIEGDSTSTAACVSSATRLCLNGGRFAVDVDWARSNGDSGTGRAVQLTDDTGYFWFFNQNNVEMVLKVLRACGINNHFWVFAGGLTNVEVDVLVTDTQSGETSRYSNPQGAQFQPIQDTEAFRTCP